MKYLAVVFACLLLWGCEDKKIDSDAFSSGNAVSKEVEEANQNLDKKSYAGLEDIFSDNSLIQTQGKYLLLVFGKNGCGYCEKLKADLKASEKTRDFLKKSFTSYYVNISYDKMHRIALKNDKEHMEVDVSTSMLSRNIYRVYVTPTIIFGDTDGRTIIEFPGYIPQEGFYKILEFITSGEWKKGKDARERMQLLERALGA